jgi:hypothetical protein
MTALFVGSSTVNGPGQRNKSSSPDISYKERNRLASSKSLADERLFGCDPQSSEASSPNPYKTQIDKSSRAEAVSSATTEANAGTFWAGRGSPTVEAGDCWNSDIVAIRFLSHNIDDDNNETTRE